jgi:SAM-dependent methyltransferase
MSPKYNNWHYSKEETVRKYNRLRTIDKHIVNKIVDMVCNYGRNFEITNKSINIIDAGCGSGRILIPLIEEIILHKKEEKYNLIGIDLSSLMLANLLEKINKMKNLIINPKWNILHIDLQDDWPFETNSVSIVYQFAVFHILSKWKNTLSEIERVLVPGGYFIYLKEINQVFHASERIFTREDSKDLEDIDLIPEVNDFFYYYHKLRDDYGKPYYIDGIEYSNIINLSEFFIKRGFYYYVFSDKTLVWMKQHTFKDIIDSIKFARVTTLGSDLPEKVRKKIGDLLHKYCLKKD